MVKRQILNPYPAGILKRFKYLKYELYQVINYGQEEISGSGQQGVQQGIRLHELQRDNKGRRAESQGQQDKMQEMQEDKPQKEEEVTHTVTFINDADNYFL